MKRPFRIAAFLAAAAWLTACSANHPATPTTPGGHIEMSDMEP